MACCQQSGSMSNCAPSTPKRARFKLRRAGSVPGSIRAAVSKTPPAQAGAMALHLVFGQHDEEVGLAGRHHGAEHPRAETHVAGDRSAALAHAVDFGLLHVQAGEEGGLGQDIRRLEHALPAQTGDDDIGDVVVHCCFQGDSPIFVRPCYARCPKSGQSPGYFDTEFRACWNCLILPAANKQGRRAIMTLSSPAARLRCKRRRKPSPSADGSTT